MGAGVVLMVEDADRDAALIEAILGAAGYATRRALSLAGGLEALRDVDFDVVLIDLGLPDAEGGTVLDVVLDAAWLAPVVVVTGRDDPEMELDALRSGAQEWLSKGSGLTSSAVLRCVRHAIARREGQRAVDSRNLEAVTQRLRSALDRTETLRPASNGRKPERPWYTRALDAAFG